MRLDLTDGSIIMTRRVCQAQLPRLIPDWPGFTALLNFTKVLLIAVPKNPARLFNAFRAPEQPCALLPG